MNSEALVNASIKALYAPGARAYIHVGGRAMRVRRPGVATVELAPGFKVRVSTDASGQATQIEETERLHAIVRLRPLNPRARQLRVGGGV